MTGISHLKALLGPGRAARWRRTVLRRLVAFLALAGALVAAQVSLRPPPATTRAVVVATTDLSAGTVIARSDLTVERVPVALLGHPAGVGSDVEGLVGRRLATPLAAGEPVSSTRLVPRSVAEGLPPGTTAVHLLATDDRMLDLVAPGVDVRLHRPADGAPLVERAAVLGVDPPPSDGSLAITPAPERGLVVAVPDEALTTVLTGPDGAPPRVHVLPAAHRG